MSGRFTPKLKKAINKHYGKSNHGISWPDRSARTLAEVWGLTAQQIEEARRECEAADERGQ